MRLALAVPLADGSAEAGRLEVFTDGGWGTVCDRKDNFKREPAFSAESAVVACRQLGFQDGTQIGALVLCRHSYLFESVCCLPSEVFFNLVHLQIYVIHSYSVMLP